MTGEELKSNRKLQGWTQQELAQRIGVSKGTVINYEKGKKIPESKNEILVMVFQKKETVSFPLENKLDLLNDRLAKRAIKQGNPSRFILNELLKNFHPVEIVDYLDQNRNDFSDLEEFILLTRNVIRNDEITDLRKEMEQIRKRLDKIPNS